MTDDALRMVYLKKQNATTKGDVLAAGREAGGKDREVAGFFRDAYRAEVRASACKEMNQPSASGSFE